jgi:MarR family 2-MHQ and catechol resistance regulon transcriptional repressor
MPNITAKNAAHQDFMPLMKELVRAYQAFTSFDSQMHRAHETGLTISQADVLFTLGNTDGMTCGEIGERTLITKGTLTGVIDRMSAKGLVERQPVCTDGRCTMIVLTPAGKTLFERTFPQHIRGLKRRFDRLSATELEDGTKLLRKIRSAFEH